MSDEPRHRLGPLILALPAAAWTFLLLMGHVLQRGYAPSAAAGLAAVIVVIGVSAMRPRRGSWALAASSWGWAAAVWFGLPLLGDVDRSSAVGIGWAALRGDLPAAKPIPRTTPAEIAPVAEAVVAEAVAPPLDIDLEEDDEPGVILLPYEGDGRRMRVPVRLTGSYGSIDTWMLFDTGATFTTLDPRSLARLGVDPGSGPELTLNTAAGTVRTTLALLEQIELDGTPVEGVSIAVCDDCASGDVSGLLGLNVTGRYRTAIDHENREVELQPLDVDDRTVDVSRWLDLSGRARTFVGLRTEVEVTGRNLSTRTVEEAVATVSCRTGAYAVQLDDIRPGREVTSRIELPGDQDCASFQLELISARW